MRSIIEPAKSEWGQLCKRPTINSDEIMPWIKELFSEVRDRGEDAVIEYAKKYDRYFSSFESINPQESGEISIGDVVKEAIDNAAENIRSFHNAQKPKDIFVETQEGVECWQKAVPIQDVGIYIPGGTAPLFSTILMLAIPAQLAGCKRVVMCTPPNKDGSIDIEMLYAAKITGVTEIYLVGGAQAIAALSLGTKNIKPVNKIFGPGNQYVTAAKQFAQQLGVAIDMPAGPSELLVVADRKASPDYVAADLLSQAEHGTDSQVICIVDDQGLLTAIEECVNNQLVKLERAEIARVSLKNSSLILLEDRQNIIDLVNEYAPEHLIINSEDESFYLDNLVNAGSVFIGQYTPESAGDYASGTNHTLPTGGAAKSYSGVNTEAFYKKLTFQRISKEGLKKLGPTIMTMAEAENLQAHKNAVKIRLLNS